MTGELCNYQSYHKNTGFDFSDDVRGRWTGMKKDAHKAVRRTAVHAARAAKKCPQKVDGMSAWVGAVAVGLVVFLICGLFCAAGRGFNGGIGGEAILAAGIACGVRFGYAKLRKRFCK